MVTDAIHVERQVQSAKGDALVLEAPDLAIITVRGSDRQSWLNGLLTCDLARLRAGEAAYGLLVEKKGKIQSDLIAMLGADECVLVVPRVVESSLREVFESHLVMEDAEIDPCSTDVRIFMVHGPRSSDVLDAARASGCSGAPFDRTGLGGALVLVPQAARFNASSASRATWGDEAGWEALRIERGIPRFGTDFDASLYPQEAGLERVAVSFSKGCYLGQEVVYMLENRGQVKRRLAVFVLDSPDVPARGTAVLDAAGGHVGEVTSAVFSPTARAPLAFALVKRVHAEPEAEVNISSVRARHWQPESSPQRRAQTSEEETEIS